MVFKLCLNEVCKTMNYKTASEILDDLCLEKTAISILGLGGTAAGAVTGAITGLHKKKEA